MSQRLALGFLFLRAKGCERHNTLPSSSKGCRHLGSFVFLPLPNHGGYPKGSGTINGEGDHKFMLWAGDGDADTFRIRIWEEDEWGNETEIYDNGFGQEIGGGSIVIHTK